MKSWDANKNQYIGTLVTVLPVERAQNLVRKPYSSVSIPYMLRRPFCCYFGDLGAVTLQITVGREMASLLRFQFSILTTRSQVLLYYHFVPRFDNNISQEGLLL